MTDSNPEKLNRRAIRSSLTSAAEAAISALAALDTVKDNGELRDLLDTRLDAFGNTFASVYQRIHPTVEEEVRPAQHRSFDDKVEMLNVIGSILAKVDPEQADFFIIQIRPEMIRFQVTVSPQTDAREGAALRYLADLFSLPITIEAAWASGSIPVNVTGDIDGIRVNFWTTMRDPSVLRDLLNPT